MLGVHTTMRIDQHSAPLTFLAGNGRVTQESNLFRIYRHWIVDFIYLGPAWLLFFFSCGQLAVGAFSQG